MTQFSEAATALLREAAAGSPVLPWQRLVDALQRATGADACSLLALQGGVLVPLAVAGLSADTLGRRFDPGTQPRLHAILAAPDALTFPADCVLADPFDGLIPDGAGRLHVHDCVGIALRAGPDALGVMTMDALAPGTFDATTIDRLRAAAGVAAACLMVVERLRRLGDVVERQDLVSRALLEELRPEQPLLGNSPAMQALRREIETVAASDLTVLVQGETGCGKELVARAIHYGSPRAARPLISVNCSALPEQLVESELFGHVAGAFSGAAGARRGKFEIADGGTLLLDEVGELPLAMQPKLLRVLQSGEIQRVGSDAQVRVNVRIVAATNRDLAAEVKAGRFRADLYHRLAIYPLAVPPLRDRGDDVLLLAGYFLERSRASLHLRGLRLSAAAQQALRECPWPGNVRELGHAISRAALKAAAAAGTREHIVTIHPRELDLPDAGLEESISVPAVIGTRSAAPGAGTLELPPLAAATDEFQRRLVAEALGRSGGNWTQAARLLHVDRANLHRLSRRLQKAAAGLPAARIQSTS
jgi:anaerobic nitric oxide reductase transcription regulator